MFVSVQPLAADDSPADGKVIGISEGEGHDAEVKGQGQGRDVDVRCQLAMSEQQLASVKRHLAESRRENDDLLKAVAYLRHKLDTLEDTPTNLHTNDNGDVTVTSTDAAADEEEEENYDDDELWGQRSSAELRNYNSK